MTQRSLLSSTGTGLLLAAVLAACGSSSQSASGTPGSSNAPGTCDKSVLLIPFTPMYTSFDGSHTFKVPAVVDGIDPTAITWSASDMSMVDLEPFTDAQGVSGTMVTARKAGNVDIVASAGGLCGKTNLIISAATADDWMNGNMRYNDGVTLQPGMVPGGGIGRMRDPTLACTNCHGDTATMGAFRTVAHTPEQTGGFSDADLMNIFRNGMVPAGGYFDPSIVPQDQWQRFHKWQMTDAEAKGLVTYLRSLTPTAQTGKGNFGGRLGDGGFRARGDGGRGSGGGGQDAAASN